MLLQTVIVTVKPLGGRSESDPTIIAADAGSISFLSDLDRSDLTPPDTLHYYIGPTSELSGTQNELDRLLHRKVNNGVETAIGAVTVFDLSYLTQIGSLLARPVPQPEDAP